MIAIRPLTHFDPQRFLEIASGYTTTEVYHIALSESHKRTTFTLMLETLPEPRKYLYTYDDKELQHYRALVPSDYYLGAFDSNKTVAVVLAEPHAWNNTLWVSEFHVAATHRGRGIGHRLMAKLAQQARVARLRALVCETQNTNVPAISFYRAVGLTLEGVDVSYYSNDDMLPSGTVAVFMKLRLQ